MAGLKVELNVTERGKKAPQYSLRSDLGGKQTLDDLFKFVQLALAETFTQVLREEQGRGFTKEPRVRVDGSFYKPFTNVLPFGKIQAFDKQNVLEILSIIYSGLIDRSRIRSGNYVQSHAVFYNDNLIAANISELERWVSENEQKTFKRGDRFDFINLAPYARKLELQGLSSSVKTGKNVRKRKDATSKTTGNAIKKPNGSYYKTFLSVRRRFKQSSGTIRFKWRPARKQARALNSGKRQSSGAPFRETFVSDDRPYIYPSIQYTIDDRGILQ